MLSQNTQEQLLGCWNPPFVHVLKVCCMIVCKLHQHYVVMGTSIKMALFCIDAQVDKDANSNIELILGEDDMAAVEEPAAGDDSAEDEQSQSGAQGQDMAAVLKQLSLIQEQLAALKTA